MVHKKLMIFSLSKFFPCPVLISGVNETFFDRLPPGVRLPLLQALFACAERPPPTLFDPEPQHLRQQPASSSTAANGRGRNGVVPLLRLLGRHDLALLNAGGNGGGGWAGDGGGGALGMEPQPERRGRRPRTDRLLQRCSELCKSSVVGGGKDPRGADGMDDLDWEVWTLAETGELNSVLLLFIFALPFVSSFSLNVMLLLS